MKKTAELTWNVRREVIPELTLEEYVALQDGKSVDVKSKKARETLLRYGLATEKGSK